MKKIIKISLFTSKAVGALFFVYFLLCICNITKIQNQENVYKEKISMLEKKALKEIIFLYKENKFERHSMALDNELKKLQHKIIIGDVQEDENEVSIYKKTLNPKQNEFIEKMNNLHEKSSWNIFLKKKNYYRVFGFENYKQFLFN